MAAKETIFKIDHREFRNFTPHDIKMAARRLSRMLQNNALSYDFQQPEQLRFCGKCLCECLLVHESDITAFYSRSEFQTFSLISGRHVGAQLHGHQHCVSIQSSVN